MLSLSNSQYWSRDYLFKNPLGRNVLYSGAVLVFLLAMFFLMLLPKTKTTISRWKKIDRMKEKNVRLERDVGLLSGWEWKEVDQTAKLVEFAFPTRKDIYLVVFAVRDPIRRHGFVIEKMSFDMGEVAGEASGQSGGNQPGGAKTKRKGGTGSSLKPDSIVVNLSVLGRQKSLSDLIDDFNHSLPLMSVSDLSFSSQGNNSSVVSVKMKLTIYFYPPQKEMNLKKTPLRDLQLTKAELKTVSSLQDYYDRGSNFYQRLKLYQDSSYSSVPSGKKRENPFLLP